MRTASKFIIGLVMLVSLIVITAGTSLSPTPLTLQYPVYFGNRIYIPADNPLTEEGVALGRMLFYEKRLSANESISCAGCHQQQYAFADNKNYSTGFDGIPTNRNTMALINLVWIKNYFWDGRTTGLEKQAIVPMTHPHEMGVNMEAAALRLKNTGNYPAAFHLAFGDATITVDRITKAIAQFERTLISCNAPYDQYLQGTYSPTTDELNGMNLFFTNPNPQNHIRGAGCAQCHGGPKTVIELFQNNGIDSVFSDAGREKITGFITDRGRFRVVTLRNISLTAPYMHDGRFKTLEQVVDHYSDHIQNTPTLNNFLRTNSNDVKGNQLQLTAKEKKELLAFLNMLTDTSFVNNPQFSDPFPNHSITANRKKYR